MAPIDTTMMKVNGKLNSNDDESFMKVNDNNDETNSIVK